jgi:hypothetical protein
LLVDFFEESNAYEIRIKRFIDVWR